MTALPWVFVAVLVLLAAAVAAELAARWWVHRTAFYVFSPGLRLHLHPDRHVFPELEQSIRFDVNGDGERGDEVPRAREGLYRVLVAGGSQPEGYLLDQPTAWPGALQRLLGVPDWLGRIGASKVHVGSIARSGVGSEALDVILERVLPRYPRLHAIVVMVGASDVLRWLEQGAPPSAASPVRISDVFMCHPEGRFGWKPQTLAMLELLSRVRRLWLRPVQVRERAGQWIGDARASRARAQEIRATTPDPAPMLDHFEKHFRRLLQRAMAHADRVIVVRQPWFDKEYSPEEAAHMWHGGAGPVWQQEVATYYSFEVVSGLMHMVDAKAAAIADELQVEQLDLMPLLERSLNTYYDCFHLTPGGARAVAGAVAGRIMRQPLPNADASGQADRGRTLEGVGVRAHHSGDRRAPVRPWAALTVRDS